MGCDIRKGRVTGVLPRTDTSPGILVNRGVSGKKYDKLHVDVAK